MCLTLPDVLVSVMGIEKVIPTWQDLEVFMQLLPRSSTGERMNPYNSFWTGASPNNDGPREFHLILLDNGRTKVLADPKGRSALHCIRCSACLNICPVYERTGGHAYNSVYPGPIGAILTPQLAGVENAGALPYASSLCGACYDVCPVKINIPEILIHLRGKVVRHKQDTRGFPDPENLAMKLLARVFAQPGSVRPVAAGGSAGPEGGLKDGFIESLPGPFGGWTAMRDVYPVAPQTFREWWQDPLMTDARTEILATDPGRDRRRSRRETPSDVPIPRTYRSRDEAPRTSGWTLSPSESPSTAPRSTGCSRGPAPGHRRGLRCAGRPAAGRPRRHPLELDSRGRHPLRDDPATAATGRSTRATGC